MSGEPTKGPKGLVKAGKVLGWLFGFIVSQLTPWLEPLFRFNLISAYYQPQSNGVAALFAALGFFGAEGFYRNTGQERLKSHLLRIWVPGFVGSFFVCLFFTLTMGVVWDPGIFWGPILKFLWFCLYFALFLCFAVVLRILLKLAF